jgi:hypothetical protein
MNIKEIIQKIFEPNYIKIYKQIEQAFFNGKRIVLNVTEDEGKAVLKFLDDYSEYEEVIEDVMIIKTGFDLIQESIPADIRLHYKWVCNLYESDFRPKQIIFDFKKMNMNKLFEIRHRR